MCLKRMWMCAVSRVNMHGRTHFKVWSLSAAHSYLSAAHACMLTHSCSTAGNHALTVSDVKQHGQCGRVLCLQTAYIHTVDVLCKHHLSVWCFNPRGRNNKTQSFQRLQTHTQTHTQLLSLRILAWQSSGIKDYLNLRPAPPWTPQTHRTVHHRENYGGSNLTLTFSLCNM